MVRKGGASHELLDIGALCRDEAIDLARFEPVDQRRLARVVQPYGRQRAC